jgi:hypothetical protein
MENLQQSSHGHDQYLISEFIVSTETTATVAIYLSDCKSIQQESMLHDFCSELLSLFHTFQFHLQPTVPQNSVQLYLLLSINRDIPVSSLVRSEQFNIQLFTCSIWYEFSDLTTLPFNMLSYETWGMDLKQHIKCASLL